MYSDGYSGCHNFCASLSMKGLGKAAFYRRASFLYQQIKLLYVSKQREAIETVRRYYHSSEGIDGDGLVDIDVSFDGTWMTRGRKSHMRIPFVVECNTGFVIDFEVICNYCQCCSQKEAVMFAAE
jgi:hypothetical protein